MDTRKLKGCAALALFSAFGLAMYGCGSDAANSLSPSVDVSSASAAVADTVLIYTDPATGTNYYNTPDGVIAITVTGDTTAVGSESSASVAVSSASSDTIIIGANSSAAAGTSSATGTSSAAVAVESSSSAIPTGCFTDDIGFYCYDANGVKVYYGSSSSAATATSSAVSSSSAWWNVSSSSKTSAVSSSATAKSSSSAVTSSATATSSAAVSSSAAATSSTGTCAAIDPTVTFTASGATVTDNNGGVSISGGTVTITCAGNYYFSGSSTDGQIIVAADTSAKVYLYLNGLTLTSASDAPIYSQSSDKTFVIVMAGTVNTLTDAFSRTKYWTYTKNGESKTDTTGACIYAKDDLTIKGSGTLTVTGYNNNGIQTSKDLKVKYDADFGGAPILNVTAANNALKGKNSVEIDGGTLGLTAEGGDGVKADEDDATELAEGKGYVQITGGSFTISAKDDGISASNDILIADSVSAPVITIVADTGKGIVTDSVLYVNAGTLNVKSTKDDGYHSNTNIYINGGATTISAGDDGIHADSTIYIKGGTVNVVTSYEAVEGWYIRASGGVTAVYATNDGWNAAGGSSTSSSSSSQGGWGGGPGGQGGQSSSTGYVYITGGFHYVKTGSGDTDGIDSNGDLSISGGVVVVECQMNGGMGGILDSDGSTSITGGKVIGFGQNQSEEGTNYSVSFNTNSYYGSTSSVAFKPTTTGTVMVSNFGTPSAVSSVSGMTQVCFPNSATNCVYYK